MLVAILTVIDQYESHKLLIQLLWLLISNKMSDSNIF